MPSPLPSQRNVLPPTPDTLNNDGTLQTQSHDTTYAEAGPPRTHISHNQHNTMSLPTQRDTMAGPHQGNETYRLHTHSDGTHGSRSPGAANERANVFPRTADRPGDPNQHVLAADSATNGAVVRLGLGHDAGSSLVVPLPSTAQRQQDQWWNDRAEDLVRTQFPELRSRPQTIQRVCTFILNAPD